MSKIEHLALATTMFGVSLMMVTSSTVKGNEPAETITHQRDGAGAVNAEPAPYRFTPRQINGVPQQPTRTVSHGRSSGDPAAPRLYVLLPEEVSVTTQAQPSLFWYLSKPTDRPVKLSINTPKSTEPVVELQLDGKAIQGIQRLDLSKLRVRLKAGIRYDWVVTLASIPNQSSPNVYAKSVVWRVDAPETLAQRLVNARNRRQRAAIAADEGIWIDALTGISDLIDHNPGDTSLRRDRADLLRQVGFSVVVKPNESEGFSEEVQFAMVVR